MTESVIGWAAKSLLNQIEQGAKCFSKDIPEELYRSDILDIMRNEIIIDTDYWADLLNDGLDLSIERDLVFLRKLIINCLQAIPVELIRRDQDGFFQLLSSTRDMSLPFFILSKFPNLQLNDLIAIRYLVLHNWKAFKVEEMRFENPDYINRDDSLNNLKLRIASIDVPIQKKWIYLFSGYVLSEDQRGLNWCNEMSRELIEIYIPQSMTGFENLTLNDMTPFVEETVDLINKSL